MLFAGDIPIYKELSSITHPTIRDLGLVQHYLTYGERPLLKYLEDYQASARNFKLIGQLPNEFPQYGEIAVNCSPDDRENCVLIYSSFNKKYPKGLKRLVDVISKSDFKGHVLYRLGGWPDLETGSLVLAHVPYAFKVCFFREAQRKGYKRVFWMDTSLLPYVSLNKIFEMIQENGYFAMGNAHTVGPYMRHPAIDAFGIRLQQANHIPSCSAGIFGVDFTSQIGPKIIDAWYQAAQNEVAFFSPRSDQNALSIILYKLGLTLCPISRLAHNPSEINSETLLLIQREYVH
jgi:hypothetical protein